MGEHKPYDGVNACMECGFEWPCKAALVAAARAFILAELRLSLSCPICGVYQDERGGIDHVPECEFRDLAALVGEETEYSAAEFESEIAIRAHLARLSGLVGEGT